MSNYKSGKLIFIASIIIIVAVALTPIFIIVAIFTIPFTITDTVEPYVAEFLNVDSMLEYCVKDGVYNGKGQYYLDGNTRHSEIINDDGRLCLEILSLSLSETAEGIQTNNIENSAPLISYYVPYDDYALIVVYEDDILGCEVHPDMLSLPHYRRFNLNEGIAKELHTLATEISNAAK